MKRTQVILSAICWVLSWTLYAAGDVASSILHARQDSARWCNFWYPVYCWLMHGSSDVQDVAGGHSRWWPWRLETLDPDD